ncbi:MAG TPA: hypothetical protein GX713_01055 [Mollicutes bacterium]|nr:hypothetical protein [Mollicutes bacterium]
MKTEVKEKLHFKKYLVFLIGYFAFIIATRVIFTIGQVGSLAERMEFIIGALLLMFFTIYVLRVYNSKKDKFILNQNDPSWSVVKGFNSLTWIIGFFIQFSIMRSSFPDHEINYLDPLTVTFSLLAILSAFLVTFFSKKIFSKEDGMQYFFYKVSFLTIFAGIFTLEGFLSIAGIFSLIFSLFS